MTAKERTEQIALLNDQLRKDPMASEAKFLFTRGVQALKRDDESDGRFTIEVFNVLGEFDDFSDANDPYGERDFGSLQFRGEKCFWKIDYYDADDMNYGSDDPADPKVTQRVLTFMLASEY